MPIQARPAVLVPDSQVVSVSAPRESANSPLFRWKVLAGVASLAAVAAVVLNVAGTGVLPTQGVLAQSPAVPAVALNVATSAEAPASTAAPVMIRNPRLDELLAAHRQSGGASALQMPAGFLRNATHETPGR